MDASGRGIDRALRRLLSDGLVEIALDSVEDPVADWLDELIAQAEARGVTVTWRTYDRLLCVVDMEA